jgi:hypothetical protein
MMTGGGPRPAAPKAKKEKTYKELLATFKRLQAKKTSK